MKIKKISILCMMSIISGILLGANAFAYSGNLTPAESIIKTEGKRLVDEADILSDEEEKELLARLDEISVRQDCDVAIITVNNMNDYDYTDITAFADDAFDYNGYGEGLSGGILFAIDMTNRKWAISTYDFGIYAFTDAGQAYITDDVKVFLSAENYKTAFDRYISYADDFLTQAHKGKPYDVGRMPKTPVSKSWFLLAPIIGFFISLIRAFAKKGKHKTVRHAISAKNYVANGGINFSHSSDKLLNTRTNARRIETERSNSNRGGGSSTHTSSSGRTHGGSSGSF